MNRPEVVSAAEWQAAREELLAREKELTRKRDALAAERRRLPMVRVEKDYVFEGPDGEVSLLDLFDGRRQLIVYRFFFEPGVARWPEAGCGGCSMFVDNVGHLAHLHARDTSLVLLSRAPQADIERFKERMGWTVPWFTTTDASLRTSTSPSTLASTSSAPTSRTAGRPRRSVASGVSST